VFPRGSLIPSVANLERRQFLNDTLGIHSNTRSIIFQVTTQIQIVLLYIYRTAPRLRCPCTVDKINAAAPSPTHNVIIQSDVEAALQ
jgi:hypothetical protein